MAFLRLGEELDECGDVIVDNQWQIVDLVVASSVRALATTVGSTSKVMSLATSAGVGSSAGTNPLPCAFWRASPSPGHWTPSTM